mmetsp:Transcript_54318/g.106294  ORF Transcript_54318/g.106294 Transcript_54318/m.106294 type:complete len:113 (+) Transcript_54318:163-501(+)
MRVEMLNDRGEEWRVCFFGRFERVPPACCPSVFSAESPPLFSPDSSFLLGVFVLTAWRRKQRQNSVKGHTKKVPKYSGSEQRGMTESAASLSLSLSAQPMITTTAKTGHTEG